MRDVAWTEPGRAEIAPGPDLYLYLRILPRETETLRITFGNSTRDFALREGRELRLRLKLADLGEGRTLRLQPPIEPLEARILEAR
mgnify:FL=1